MVTSVWLATAPALGDWAVLAEPATQFDASFDPAVFETDGWSAAAPPATYLVASGE